MAGELAVRGSGALKKAATKGALKKAAKKGALKKAVAKKAAGKKAAGKKAPGKKSTKHGIESSPIEGDGAKSHAFHHLRRAAALVALLKKESGEDLRMLFEEGISAYRRGTWDESVGLLRAAEHLGMAGLYAARAEHRVAVEEPGPEAVYRMLDRTAVRLDSLPDFARSESRARLRAMASELLHRAEAADHDLHLAWELLGAADGICSSLNGTRV